MKKIKAFSPSIYSPLWRRLFYAGAASCEPQLSHSLGSHLQCIPHHSTTKPHFKPYSFSTHQNPKIETTQKHSLQSSGDNYDESSVLESLSCYENDYKRALEYFHWLETDYNFNHTTETYNKMIDISGKFLKFDSAWNLIEKMSKTNNVKSLPDYITFRIMFKRYVSARLVKEAIAAYRRLGEFNLKDKTSFLNLIDALCEYKHVIEADELCFGKSKNSLEAGEMFFDGKDTKIYNMILRGYCKMSQGRKCQEFWKEMDNRGVKKDLYSYSIYMDMLCTRGQPQKAVNLYNEIKRKRIKLDVVAYNTVFRAVGQCDGVDAAMSIYHEMRELGQEVKVSSFNIIVKFLCQNERFKEAYEMLDKMTSCGCPPNVYTYHCFFTCLEKPGEILELFDRMFQNGVFPRMDTYVLLMRKFGKWGFLRPVFVVWNKMEEHGSSPDDHAYNALIDALLKKRMVDMARKYDDEMLAKGLSSKPRVKRVKLQTEEE